MGRYYPSSRWGELSYATQYTIRSIFAPLGRLRQADYSSKLWVLSYPSRLLT